MQQMSKIQEAYNQLQIFKQYRENYNFEERELIIEKLRIDLNKKP